MVFAEGYSGGIPFFPQGNYSDFAGRAKARDAGASGGFGFPWASDIGATKAVCAGGTTVSGALFIGILRYARGAWGKFSVDGMGISSGYRKDLRVFPGVFEKNFEGCRVEGGTD